MKKKACSMIDHVAANLDLHEIVTGRAKEMFAEFRDLREHIHQFEAIVAGCILASYLDTAQLVRQAEAKALANPVALDSFGQPKPVDEKVLHPFHCPYCNMQFNAKRGMQFHNCDLKPDEKTGQKRKVTELQPFASPTSNDTILTEIKDGKKWFKCVTCARLYERESALVEHNKRHVNQMKKRKIHISENTLDSTRLAKTTLLASANPSVQVNQHEQVLFRGSGRRPWLKHLQDGLDNP